MTRANAPLIALLLVVGCSPPITIYKQVESGTHVVGCAGTECGDSSRLISVTYLGVSGLLIEHRGRVLLTAPFFSNPSLGMVSPRLTRLLRSTPRISSDTLAIDRLLPHSADRATAILVGHGHYDHLMDIPYIAVRRATSSRIFGGPSVRHMLMGDSTLRSNGGQRSSPFHSVRLGRGIGEAFGTTPATARIGSWLSWPDTHRLIAH